MKLKMFYFSLLLVTTACHTQAEGPVEIIKCCPEGFILNLSYNCIESSLNFIEAVRKSESGESTQSIKLQIAGHKKPACETNLEHQKLNERNVLTSSGGVSSYKYKDTFEKEDVCFDILEEENGEHNVAFLNCDPCTKQSCVNLCCPHGQAYKDDLEEELDKKHRCDPEPGIRKRCLVHDEEELVWREDLWAGGNVVGMGNRKDILFVNEGVSFKCAGKKSLVPAEFLFGPQDMRLQADGPLYVLLEHAEQNSTEKMVFTASQFCLAFTDIPEYEDYYDYGEQNESSTEISTVSERKLRPLYSVCYEVKAEKGEYFTGIFYPTAIFISCFFILVTIIIYGMLDDLRSNLFGKITLGFLCNVFICYFFLGVHYSLDLKESKEFLNTGFCIFLGYITHHTFIAFFFWTNAMAINITHKFSNILMSSNEGSQKKALILNMLYAQGVPLLITLVTALIDAYGSCDTILPNMGKYTCFLGAEFNPNIIFIFTPEFLFYYLIISVIMISNLICFIITGYFLTSHWSTVRNMQTSKDDNLWVHIMVVVKLFLIMGIPWTLDVISAAIAHQHGSGQTFEARLALDILNLLTGLVIFLVLICKKPVFKKLVKKCGPGYQQNSSSSNKNQESMNLRKFSTVSGISTVSTLSGVSTKTVRSEIVLEEEEGEETS